MEPMSWRSATHLLVALAVIASAGSVAVRPPVAAASDDCTETLNVYDTHDLLADPDILLDFSTLIDVESMVDDYTYRIDEALDAESDGLEPPDGISSDDLIDEGRWEIGDAIDLGRSFAGC